MDRRTKYTKNVIRESLLEIMEEKEISKVTVTEICELADINRATFYKYYLDVYDLLGQIEAELFEEFKNSINPSSEDKDVYKIILSIIYTIERNKYLFKVLLSPNGNKEFLLDLMYYARENLFKKWEEKFKGLREEEFNYVYMYVANGIIAISQLWLKNDCVESPEEIADLIIKITKNGTDSFAN